MRLGHFTFAMTLLLNACDSPTGLGSEGALVMTSAKSYVAEATPLPATVGFLTRYDFDVLVIVVNRSGSPMILDRCDGELLALVTGGGAPSLNEDAAQFLLDSERGLCDDFSRVTLLPGEWLTHHARFWGLSSSAVFLDSMDKQYHVLVSDRGRPLWSAPFTIHLPTPPAPLT